MWKKWVNVELCRKVENAEINGKSEKMENLELIISGKCGNKWTKVENSDSGGKVESMKKRNMWKWMEMYGKVKMRK